MIGARMDRYQLAARLVGFSITCITAVALVAVIAFCHVRPM